MNNVTPFIIWLNKNELDQLLSLLIDNSNKKDEILTRSEMDKYCEKIIEMNNRMCDLLKSIEPIKAIKPSDIVAYRYHSECNNIQQFNEIKNHCGKYHPNLKKVEEQLIETLGCNDCKNHNSTKISIPDFENKYKPKKNKK